MFRPNFISTRTATRPAGRVVGCVGRRWPEGRRKRENSLHTTRGFSLLSSPLLSSLLSLLVDALEVNIHTHGDKHSTSQSNWGK